jgi:hypothetical protein
MAWVWELRNPDGAMLGMEFARGTSDPTDCLLAHALPERISVTVTDDDRVIARGDDLGHEASTPIARLWVRGSEVSRENVWPDESDLGRPVILPGGEIGILQKWWHADDHREWRWQVEFSNSLR